MTRDCPIGLAALRRRARWMLARVAASLALVVSGVAWAFNAVHPHRNRGSVTSVQPLQTLKQWLTGPPAPVPMMGTPSPMMGRIAFPSPPAPPTVNGALPRPSEAPAPDCESQ